MAKLIREIKGFIWYEQKRRKRIELSSEYFVNLMEMETDYGSMGFIINSVS